MAFQPAQDPSSVPPPRIARFGAFELDLRSGLLSRSGRPVKLQDQPARLLVHLVENAGKLVTREELRELLWPADTFVEFDTSLNTAVRKVRQGLDDAPDTPHFLETVPRKGYRFIAAVTYPITAARAPDPEPLLEVMPPPVTPAESAVAPARAPSRVWMIAAAAFGAIALAAVGVLVMGQRPSFTGTVERASFDLPDNMRIAIAFGPTVAISSNGEVAAFTGSGSPGPVRIYYHRFSGGVTREVPGATGGTGIFLSPDGERIAFRQNGWLTVATLDGMDRKRLAHVGVGIPEGGFWAKSGDIYYTAPSRRGTERLNTSIWKIPASEPDHQQEVTALLDPATGQKEWHTNIQELPGGDLLLSISRGADREIWIVDPQGTRKNRILKASGGFYVPTGHLIFYRGTSLYAAPLDLNRREIAGPEAQIEAHVGLASWSGGNAAVSANGTLLFTQRAKAVPARTLTWVSFDGKETPIPVPPGPHAPSDLSLDGKHVLISKYDENEAHWGLWTMPLGTGEWRKVSDGHPTEVFGVFAGDSHSVLFNRMGTGLMRRNMATLGAEECLAAEPDYSRFPAVFAPGQKEILFAEGYRPVIRTVLYALPFTPQSSPRRLSEGDSAPRLSPDQKWIASLREGRVAVRPFPLASGVAEVSAGVGTAPVWSQDGRTIYFADAKRQMVAVPFLPGPSFRFGPARVLFDASRYELGSRWHAPYLLSRDGKAFLMARNEDTEPVAPPATIHVVRNWFAVIQRLAHPAR